VSSKTLSNQASGSAAVPSPGNSDLDEAMDLGAVERGTLSRQHPYSDWFLRSKAPADDLQREGERSGHDPSDGGCDGACNVQKQPSSAGYTANHQNP